MNPIDLTINIYSFNQSIKSMIINLKSYNFTKSCAILLIQSILKLLKEISTEIHFSNIFTQANRNLCLFYIVL